MLPLEEVFGERMNIAALRLLATVQGGLSGNEIARRLGLQQTTIRKALERLVARGVVTRTNVGRAAAYELNTGRAVVQRIILPLFRAESELLVELWTDLVAAVSRLRPRPTAVVLYGSVARAVRAPGDLDLLIVARSDAEEERLRESLPEITPDFEGRYQLPIRAVVLTQAELQKRAREPLIESVLKEGIFLFGEPVGPLRKMRKWHRMPMLESA